MNRKPSPGVSRHSHFSDESLQRLDRQLSSGSRISDQVLAQWIKKYGDPAREVIKKYGFYHDGLEA